MELGDPGGVICRVVLPLWVEQQPIATRTPTIASGSQYRSLILVTCKPKGLQATSQ